jgi:effector-binding domain-containing protein
LKDLGLSLDQIGDLLKRDLPPDQLRGMLMLKQAEIEQEMQAMQTQMRRVEARLKQIECEGQPPQYEVVLKSVEAQTLVSYRKLVPDLNAMVDYRCEMYNTLYRWLADNDSTPQDHELAIYYNAEYVETDIDMELGTPVDRMTLNPATLPEGIALHDLPAVETMASVIHKGDMWDIGQAMVALYSWIGSHGYAPAGPYRELHLFWREHEIETEQFRNIVIEMQIPIVSQ